VDPDSLDTDTDPSFQVNPNPDTDPDPEPIHIQSFDDQKLKEKMQLKNCFFIIQNCNLYIPRPHKGRLSNSRSLQQSKENLQHFKK
jgi:hypothetical protein